MRERLRFLDGAMGTELQKLGLPAGTPPFLLCMTNPAAVADVHRAYAEAGADILYANTFGANALSLKGTGYTVREQVVRAIEIAKSAAPDAEVALDICALGDTRLLDGEMTYDDAYEIFAEIVDAGRDADLIAIETMFSVREMRSALRAARSHSKLRVFASMTFNTDGRTFMGDTVEQFAELAREYTVDAVGLNCSSPPTEMYGVFTRLKASAAEIPLLIKLNAGNDAGNRLSPDAYAQSVAPYVADGAAYVGACCGSTPEHIRAIKQLTMDN